MAQCLRQAIGNSVLFRGVMIKQFLQSTSSMHSAAAIQSYSKCRPSEVYQSLFISSLNTDSLKTPYTVDPPKIKIVDVPFPMIHQISYVPLISDVKYEDKLPEKEIEDPLSSSNIEKKAARLIVIRRRKMRRHKLKKLRKKMKFEWAKIRQKREMKKEKDFQAELLAKIREAERFNAKLYAKEKTRLATEKPFPRRWKGKRLPQFVIRDLLEKQKKKREEIEASKRRRQSMSMNVADYELKSN